jgi:peptidoglycan/LPS O-acetylase OafA/YrhL
VRGPNEAIASDPAPNDNNLYWIRHCAALGVLLGHSYVLVGRAAPKIFGEQIHIVSIKVFFIISGYLVCKSWERDKAVFRYLTKRIVRIFPGLILVVLITAFVIGPITTQCSLHDYFSSSSFGRYFWNIALAPDFRLPGVFSRLAPNDGVNGSLWSLPVEFAMYLLVPIFSWSKNHAVLKLANIALTGFLVVASIYFQTAGASLVQPVIYWTSIPFALQIAAFFACSSWYQSFKLDRFLNLQAALAMAILLQLFGESNILNEALMLFGLPYIILSISLAPRALFASRERLGDASYGIYLYAFPVQQCVILWFGKDTHPIWIAIIALPATVMLAMLSWHGVEKRALKWKPALSMSNRGMAHIALR